MQRPLDIFQEYAKGTATVLLTGALTLASGNAFSDDNNATLQQFALVDPATTTLQVPPSVKQDLLDTEVAAPIGKPVTLRVGRGFSVSAADGLADVLNEEGCPTTVTDEGGRFKRITVEVDDKSFGFKQSGSAGSQALDWCLPTPEQT